jgi:hypothetical protein
MRGKEPQARFALSHSLAVSGFKQKKEFSSGIGGAILKIQWSGDFSRSSIYVKSNPAIYGATQLKSGEFHRRFFTPRQMGIFS